MEPKRKKSSEKRIWAYAHSPLRNAVRHILVTKTKCLSSSPSVATLRLHNVPTAVTLDIVRRWMQSYDDVTVTEQSTGIFPEEDFTSDNAIFLRHLTRSSRYRNVTLSFGSIAQCRKVWTTECVSMEDAADHPPRAGDSTDVHWIHADDTIDAEGETEWTSNYSVPYTLSEEETQGRVDEFMAEFDQRQHDRRREEKKAQLADDDGWVTVTTKRGGGRKAVPTLVQTGLLPSNSAAAAKHQHSLSRCARRKAKQRLLDKQLPFYRHERGHAEKVAKLQEKFEGDKAKAAKMKEGRVFKPH